MSNNLEPFQSGNKWGYKDATGQVRIQPQFDEAGRFYNRLARVRIGNEINYIDERGRTFIKSPNFPNLQSSDAEGVKIDKHPNYTATIPSPPQLNEPDKNFSGLKRFKEGEKHGSPPQLNEPDKNFSGLKRFKEGEKHGYKNEYGKVCIAPQFAQAWPFSEGLAAVKIDLKWGYIDESGQCAIPFIFDYASSFFVDSLECKARVCVGKRCFYINKQGHEVISHFHRKKREEKTIDPIKTTEELPSKVILEKKPVEHSHTHTKIRKRKRT